MNDVGLLIIGGGASGLAAAVEAARQGADVTVLEKLDRVGKKILATGNGRCNLLNLNASPADYNDPPFVGRVFAQIDVQSDLRFFRSMGLLTAADAEGRVYPRSNAASSVLDVLRMECARLGVRFLCGEAASSILSENGAFIVDGAHRARAVIVACGGKASPAHGTDGSGYRLPEAFGHTCTDLRPALVQLRTEPDFVRGLKGLRAAVALTLCAPDGGTHMSEGEALFTDYGLSGIAAMELSRYASDGGTLYIDFFPDLDGTQMLSYLRSARERDCPLEQLLLGALHSRIGQAVLRDTLRRKLSAPCASLTDGELQTLAGALKAFSIAVRGTKGFADAQVTAGGLEVSEFTDALESRCVPGLFACGEILNIDGKCGGYNLTFAWSSGRLAGRSAAQFIKA